MRNTKFDEYGMPIFSTESQTFPCQLMLGKVFCDFQKKSGCRASAKTEKVLQHYFGMCCRCWEMIGVLRKISAIPEGTRTVRHREGELNIWTYAVPTRAIESLEALWEEQKAQKLSDQDYEFLRSNRFGYFEWESEKHNHTIALYPWKRIQNSRESDAETQM